MATTEVEQAQLASSRQKSLRAIPQTLGVALLGVLVCLLLRRWQVLATLSCIVLVGIPAFFLLGEMVSIAFCTGRLRRLRRQVPAEARDTLRS